MNPKKTAKYYMIFSTATFGTLSIFVRNISLPSGGAMVLGFSLYNELGSGDPEHETA